MTGDGLADIVLLEDDQVRVYPSQDTDGFGASLVQAWEHSAPIPRQGAISEVILFLTRVRQRKPDGLGGWLAACATSGIAEL